MLSLENQTLEWVMLEDGGDRTYTARVTIQNILISDPEPLEFGINDFEVDGVVEWPVDPDGLYRATKQFRLSGHVDMNVVEADTRPWQLAELLTHQDAAT